MKRSLFAGLAAAAVLTGCGSSGHKVVTPGRPIAGPVPPSPHAFRFSAASNRELARRDVRKLIRNVVLPRSARRVPKVPRSVPPWFRDELSGTFPGAEIARRTWVVRAPLEDVVRYFRTHADPRPRPVLGFTRSPNRVGSRPRDDWLFQPIPGRSETRWLNVAMLTLPSGATVVVAQAGDAWIHPPPSSAELPGSVRRIDITSRYGNAAPSVRVHVRDRYDVASIVAWMNGLGVTPQVVCLGWGLFGGPTITLAFRTASGHVLAQGTLGPAVSCGALSLTVKGQEAPPLKAGDLLPRIEQRLHADFSPPVPGDVSRCLRGRGWHVRKSVDGLAVRKTGPPSAITFHLTGKVTVTGARHPAISRCLRNSPHLVYYR